MLQCGADLGVRLVRWSRVRTDERIRKLLQTEPVYRFVLPGVPAVDRMWRLREIGSILRKWFLNGFEWFLDGGGCGLVLRVLPRR